MATKLSNKQKTPNVIRTKIVGTTFEGRQKILEFAENHQVEFLLLEREPTNPHDEDAIKVMAPVYRDGVQGAAVQLGYIGNSERMCIVCGKLVDGGSFTRTKTVKCPDCGKLSQFAMGGDFTCPDCSVVFNTANAKTVTCPTCFGDEWARDGIATLLARAIDSGIQYACRVDRDEDGKLMYTGGDADPKSGRKKSRGCNIKIERLEKSAPV